MIKSYFHKIFKGEVSLFQTFWIWFITITVLLELFFENNYINEKISNSHFANFWDLLLYFISFSYSIFIFLAVFRSANRYLGKKIWSLSSKIAVTINLIFTLSIFNEIIKAYFLEDYFIKNDIENFKKELPIDVDYATQLVDIKLNNKSITYLFKIDDVVLENNPLNPKFKRDIQNNICETPENIQLLKKEYSIVYKYINKNSDDLTTIVINKNICGDGIYDLEIMMDLMKKDDKL